MSVEDDLRRIDEKQKASFLQAEKRLASLESAIQNISLRMQQGGLAPEQEQRVASVEEKLEGVEDLQMVANLDLIKIREAAEKMEPGGFAARAPPAGTGNALEGGALENLESRFEKLEEKVGDITSSGGSVSASKPTADIAARNDIKKMREDFESFRKETEDSVKIIVSSIKKIIERMK